MWGETLFARAKHKLTARAVIESLQQLAQTLRVTDPQPLDLLLPDGTRLNFGSAPEIVLTIREESFLQKLAQPSLDAIAEAFVEGQLDIQGDLRRVIGALHRLLSPQGVQWEERRGVAKHEQQQDRADIQFHYDVGNAFYQLWLDRRMVYSCAYFQHGDEAIDAAQEAKLDHICRKLRLQAGERVLDVGCGWGGLLLHAAQRYGVKGVGITLSDAQLQLARERIAQAGLHDRIEILLLDYRELPARFAAAPFDKAASVGMFEHVGLAKLGDYCKAVAAVLNDRGLFLNHGITLQDTEHRQLVSAGSDFMDKYVFPNGELPHVSALIRAMSMAGFEVTDLESLRPHYALTLDRWLDRLEANQDAARALTSEKTVRVWRAYMAGCCYAFEQGWMNVYQALASKQAQNGLTVLPLTRAWIYPPGSGSGSA